MQMQGGEEKASKAVPLKEYITAAFEGLKDERGPGVGGLG